MTRILVIEDETQILNDMVYLLQEENYEVEGRKKIMKLRVL